MMQDYQEKGLHVRIDEPATWDDMPGSRFIHYENAELSDIQAWLADQGLVAVPKSYIHFIDTCLEASREGCGIDGGDVQDSLCHIGVIEEYEATEACCPDCLCADDSDCFPVTCYRDSEGYKQILKASQGES